MSRLPAGAAAGRDSGRGLWAPLALLCPFYVSCRALDALGRPSTDRPRERRGGSDSGGAGDRHHEAEGPRSGGAAERPLRLAPPSGVAKEDVRALDGRQDRKGELLQEKGY